MELPEDKLKIIPIWFVAMILLIGAVGASGLWMMGFDFSPKYGEPLVIRYNDELKNDDWVNITEFPTETTSDPINLTYGTYHNYIQITHTGDRGVNITASFEPVVEGGVHPKQVGFVLLKGIVEPERARWEGDTIRYGSRRAKVKWGELEKTLTLESGETANYTLVHVLKENASIDPGKEDLRISWNFIRNDPVSDPSYRNLERAPYPEFGAGGPDLFNTTPISILAAILGSAILGYILIKKIKEEVMERGGG